MLHRCMNDAEALKKIAGEAACTFVKTGMRVGLGTGSTVKYTVLELGRRVQEEGLEIVGVAAGGVVIVMDMVVVVVVKAV